MYKKAHYYSKSIIVLGLLSCQSSSNSENIIISEINSPCDCIDAYDLVASDMLELLETYDTDNKTSKKSSTNEQETILNVRYNKIDDRCDELSFPKRDLKACDKYNAVSIKMKKINHKRRL